MRVKHCFTILIAYAYLFMAGISLAADSDLTSSPQGKKLIELANQGEFTNELVSQFNRYSHSRVLKTIQAPREFWEWLAKHHDIGRGLLVGLHPDYNQEVVDCFVQLHDEYGDELDEYRHLALAFSFVYGQAKGKTIRADWMDWAAPGRDVPTCLESFEYYMQYKDCMLYKLKKMPWPLLLHLADNDTPIKERLWVLAKYKNRSLESLKGLYSEIKYVKNDHVSNYEKVSGAMELKKILERGGVCSQRSYYSSRVLKCLGVPTIRIAIPGHTYMGWLKKGKKSKNSTQIVGSLGRKDGYYFEPLTRTNHTQYEFAMLADAINVSYEKYLKGMIACHVVRMMPDESKSKVGNLLEQAISSNPYCTDVWKMAAQYCKSGLISNEKSWEFVKTVKNEYSKYPELAYLLASKIAASKYIESLKKSEGINNKTRRQLIGMLKWFESIKRPDLAQQMQDVLSLYVAVTKRKLGTLRQQVTETYTQKNGRYVWQVLPEAPLPVPSRLKISIKHAAAGKAGAIYATAWADTDDNGIPDKMIKKSPLLKAKAKNQWSSWECDTDYPKVFVGFETRDQSSFYYQVRGEMIGYIGLSDRVYYTRDLMAKPTRYVEPRYPNIRVELLKDKK